MCFLKFSALHCTSVCLSLSQVQEPFFKEYKLIKEANWIAESTARLSSVPNFIVNTILLIMTVEKRNEIKIKTNDRNKVTTKGNDNCRC
jgi:hypothetical protein